LAILTALTLRAVFLLAFAPAEGDVTKLRVEAVRTKDEIEGCRWAPLESDGHALGARLQTKDGIALERAWTATAGVTQQRGKRSNGRRWTRRVEVMPSRCLSSWYQAFTQ
jgi:hypothetical protein